MMLRFVSTSLCPYCGKPALRLRCVFAIRGFIENASRGVERVQGGGFGHRSAFLRLLFALAWQAAKNAKSRFPSTALRTGSRGLNWLRKNACATNRCHSGLKSSLIRNGFRGPEGPLFHGTTRIHGAARICSLVLQVSEISMSAELDVYVARLCGTRAPVFRSL